MQEYLKIAEIAISVILITLILLQERTSGAGGLFANAGGEFYQQRRGFEKFIFMGTVVLIALFAGTAAVSLFIK